MALHALYLVQVLLLLVGSRAHTGDEAVSQNCSLLDPRVLAQMLKAASRPSSTGAPLLGSGTFCPSLVSGVCSQVI